MPIHLLNDSSAVYSAAHPFEVSEYVRQNVGTHSLRLSRSRDTNAALSHRRAGALDLCRLSYGTQARVVSDGLGDIYHAQFILQGTCRYNLPGTTIDLPAGHVLVINPDEALDLTYSSDCEKFIVRIPASMLDEACSEHRWFKSNESIKFSQTPQRFEDINSLLMLLKLLCEEAESGLATPQMLQHYNRVVTTKLMVLLKHNVNMVSPGECSPNFERLAHFIDRNIKLELSAEDLARQAGLSVRSLYMLFEKCARMTPKQFVRKKKLEQVHAILSDPQQPCPNVTAIALEYGFTHLGRFSELYKLAFGILPSQSIRSRHARNKS